METEASLVSKVFPAVRQKPQPIAEPSRTAFNEAQAVEAKVWVQELAARLQRPEGEKERTTVSGCYFPTLCKQQLKGKSSLLWQHQNCLTTFPKASDHLCFYF